MALSNRQIQLIHHIYDQQVANLSLADIARHLDVTIPTVRSDVEGATPVCAGYGVVLSIEGGNTLRVEGMGNLPQLIAAIPSLRELTFAERVTALLLFEPGFVSVRAVADRLYVSRSFAEKHLPQVVGESHGRMVMEHRRGVMFEQSLEVRRRTFIDLFLPYLVHADYVQSVRMIDAQQADLLTHFTERQLERARLFVSNVIAATGYGFADGSVRQLFLFVIYTLWAREEGLAMSQETPLSTQRPEAPESNLIDQMRDAVRVALRQSDMSLPPHDADDIAQLMLASRKHERDGHLAADETTVSFVREVLAGIKELFGIDLTGDERLVAAAALHIYATVVRRDTVTIQSDAYQEQQIRNQYPLGYELAVYCASRMTQRYGFTISEGEIIYLCLHFQVALERAGISRSFVRAIVVCHFGQAAVNLIAEKLAHLFPSLDIVGTYSLQEYLHGHEPCDLVIATTHLEESGVPVIYVTPAMHEFEVSGVRDFLHWNQAKTLLAETIRGALIVDLASCETVDEVLALMAGKLEEVGAARPGFATSVIEREHVSSTSIRHIAIPHGDPELVEHTALVIGRRTQPLLWGGEQVGCALLLACTKEVLHERTNAFSGFYRRLANRSIEDGIFELRGVVEGDFRERLAALVTQE